MALYEDNSFKFVAVLNGKVDIGMLMNALGHMAAGLVGAAPSVDKFEFLRYMDGSNGVHPAISKYPFIVLKAKNGNQIRVAREKAMESGILYNDFAASMIGSSAEQQLAQTAGLKEDELEYWGLCLYGHKDELDEITKRFSIFRA